MPDKVRWIRSYVTRHERGGRMGTVCIYQASRPGSDPRPRPASGIPADTITPVADTVIVRPDPTNT